MSENKEKKEVSLKDFYSDKVSEYLEVDPEAIIRYQRAIELSRFTNKNLKLLDIGCRNAQLRGILNKSYTNIDYFGVDITDEVFKLVPDYDSSKFFVADVTDSLPFDNKSFDYVFALEIMEHVKSPSDMLQEIKRVLKPEGRLILSIPNVYSWNEILSNYRKRKDTEGHISSFPFQILERLIEFNNFKIENYCGTYTRIPFSKRFLKKQYKLINTDNMFLSRSYIYRIINK